MVTSATRGAVSALVMGIAIGLLATPSVAASTATGSTATASAGIANARGVPNPRAAGVPSAASYTITVSPDPAVGCWGSRAGLNITVRPTPEVGGILSVYHDASLIATANLDATGSSVVSTDELGPNTNSFRIDFVPAGATDVASTAAATVEGRDYCAETEFSADHSTAVSGETLVRFSMFAYESQVTGSVKFTDEYDGASKTIGTVALVNRDEGPTATLSVRLVGVGTHVVRAVYSGDSLHGSEGSKTVTVEVTGDTGVAVAGVGVSYSVFYPYKDGYRDTVGLRGNLLEPSSVTIRVYSPTNRLVRSYALSTRSGAYSIAWNGRTSSGTLLVAAKYRVVQTIRDVAGHKKVVTAYTTLSKKRIYWYTGSITKYGDAYSLYDYSDFGWVRSSSRYYRGVSLYGNILNEYANVGYHFTLRAAAAYGTLTFKVLGTPRSGHGVPYISVWNFSEPREDGIRYVGRSYAWYSTRVSSKGHVTSTHRVRAYVNVEGQNRGWYEVAKVRLTYRYGILR